MATAPVRIEPPVAEVPLRDDGQHTKAWADYHQSVSDRLGAMPALVRKGAVDGSDAVAGDIGEYFTTSASGVALTSNVALDVVTLALPAGDFDVSGFVTFTPAAGTTTTHLVAGMGTGWQELYAPFPAGSGVASFALGTGMPTRYNAAGPQTAHLAALAGFVGTMTATGTIVARRAR